MGGPKTGTESLGSSLARSSGGGYSGGIGHESSTPMNSRMGQLGPAGMFLASRAMPPRGASGGKGGAQPATVATPAPRQQAVYENVANPKPWALK